MFILFMFFVPNNIPPSPLMGGGGIFSSTQVPEGQLAADECHLLCAGSVEVAALLHTETRFLFLFVPILTVLAGTKL